jgi:hypothetical protein
MRNAAPEFERKFVCKLYSLLHFGGSVSPIDNAGVNPNVEIPYRRRDRREDALEGRVWADGAPPSAECGARIQRVAGAVGLRDRLLHRDCQHR